MIYVLVVLIGKNRFYRKSGKLKNGQSLTNLWFEFQVEEFVEPAMWRRIAVRLVLGDWQLGSPERCCTRADSEWKTYSILSVAATVPINWKRESSSPGPIRLANLLRKTSYIFFLMSSFKLKIINSIYQLWLFAECCSAVAVAAVAGHFHLADCQMSYC